VVSVLISPKFCYRLDLIDAEATRTTSPYQPLSGYALASRLSYFLWASMPDDELLAAAGSLHKKDVLLAQTRRMLKDPRVRGMAREFGGNWLDFGVSSSTTRSIATVPQLHERSARGDVRGAGPA
jgi:hypothetical protein